MRRAAGMLLVFFLGCAGETPAPPPPENASVLIVNKSQYELQELRMHEAPDYKDAPNLLMRVMRVDDDLLFYGGGAWYVTVIREKYRQGPMLAFTTGQPIRLDRGRGYTLTVFDESFRLTDTPWIDPDITDRPYLGEPYPDGRPDAGPAGTSDGGPDESDGGPDAG